MRGEGRRQGIGNREEGERRKVRPLHWEKLSQEVCVLLVFHAMSCLIQKVFPQRSLADKTLATSLFLAREERGVCDAELLANRASGMEHCTVENQVPCLNL